MNRTTIDSLDLTAVLATTPWSIQEQDVESPDMDVRPDDVTPSWVIIVHALSLAVIAVASGILNVLVGYTIHKRSYLQNASNRFVFSMTVAGAVVTITVLPFNLAACIMREWIFGLVWCNLMGFITLCSLTGILFNIALITLDRYYAIVQPMMYPLKITSNYTSHLIVAVWILALICTLPPSFGWSRYSYSSAKSACMVDWHYHQAFSWFFAVSVTIFPFGVIFYCYFGILKVARRSSRRVSHGNAVVEEAIQVMTRRRSRRTSLLVNIRMNSPTKALRTILITVGAILITWVPFIVELAYETLLGVELIADWLEVGATWLMYCSLVISPFIYALWNKTVRNEILGMFCARSVSLQWAWRDDDNILAKRRESRRLSISGSVTDPSYSAAAFRGNHLLTQTTQVTHSGPQTSSNDSVVSGVPLASILETSMRPSNSSSSRKGGKHVRVSSRQNGSVTPKPGNHGNQVSTRVDVHELPGQPLASPVTTKPRTNTSSMVTRSQSRQKLFRENDEQSNDGECRKLSIVSVDESSIS